MKQQLGKVETSRTAERPFEYAVIHKADYYGNVVVSLWDTLEEARAEIELIKSQAHKGTTYLTRFEEVQ